MVEAQTEAEYLEGIIKGKEKTPICTGEGVTKHKPTKYELHIGNGLWLFGCPECGFGSAGSLPIEDCKRLALLVKDESGSVQ